jgi:cell division protein FtsN
MILALLVGPSVAGWFGSELPQSLFPLLPWAPFAQSADSGGSSAESTAAPATADDAHRVARADGAGADRAGSPPPAGLLEPPARANPAAEAPTVVASASPAAPTGGGRAAGGASTPERAREGGPAVPAAGAARPDRAKDAPARLSAPPAVYWVQVGAFLDHRNADRLAERLRGEGFPVGMTAFEQSRVRYRVLLAAPDGGPVPDQAAEQARALGHTVETTPDGPAVGGLVSLRAAVEISQALRQRGLAVRLKQHVSSATYRVVRVGSFPTAAEAETALATLVAGGLEGLVVQER